MHKGESVNYLYYKFYIIKIHYIELSIILYGNGHALHACSMKHAFPEIVQLV